MKDSTRQQADALAGARPPLLLTATADTSPEKSSSARLAALARRGSALARTALAGLSAATLLTATSCANPGDGPLGGGAANGQGTGAMVGAGAALGTGSTGAGGTGIPLEVLDDTGQVVDCAARRLRCTGTSTDSPEAPHTVRIQQYRARPPRDEPDGSRRFPQG